MKKVLACFLSAMVLVSGAFTQVNLNDTVRSENSSTRSAASGFAEEEFRRGVQSFYRGAFNESIRSFETALSYLPGETLILDWLGKAYYRAGIEGAALQQWQYAANLGYGGILLQNRMEIISERRIVNLELEHNQRYTESGAFPYVNGNALVYSQPISVLPNDDGSIWVCAYGSNELVCFDVNGVVVRRWRGPITGLDRPSDMIRLSTGDLLVCESAGDRLCVLDKNGFFKKYIGSRGIGEGQLVGPQYIAQDSFGNIYVTDFGNARVVVFDKDGNPLLHFGKKTSEFSGFNSPTGIAVVDDRIFVADSVKGGIYEFDRSGNYIGALVNEGTFVRPECMKVWGNYLIITDKNRVCTVDVETGASYENARTGNAPGCLTCAVPDRNGNIIVTDFDANEIYVMAKMPELVGGFFVQIERVIADNFPEVVLEVRVENRRRQQVVGLNEMNFFITENKHSVSNMKFLGAANNNDYADITFLVDRALDMKKYEDQVNSIVREISASMNGKGTVQIVSCSDIPVIEYSGNPNKLSDFSVSALKGKYSDNGSLDLAIRQSTNTLINGEKKRGIIYITSGSVGQHAFEKYALSDLSTYMNNNSISFSTVLVKETAPEDEIKFLTENTSGFSYYVYRPEGLGSVMDDIIALPSGLYQLSYTSALPVEYGLKYLKVEVETYLLNRSGRDETGYFAPLQ